MSCVYEGFNKMFSVEEQGLPKLIVPQNEGVRILTESGQLFVRKTYENAPQAGLTTFVLDEELAIQKAGSAEILKSLTPEAYHEGDYANVFVYAYYLTAFCINHNLNFDLYLPAENILGSEASDVIIMKRAKVDMFTKRVSHTKQLEAFELAMKTLNDEKKMDNLKRLGAFRELVWKQCYYPTLLSTEELN